MYFVFEHHQFIQEHQHFISNILIKCIFQAYILYIDVEYNMIMQ